jgi:hypothetical protein
MKVEWGFAFQFCAEPRFRTSCNGSVVPYLTHYPVDLEAHKDPLQGVLGGWPPKIETCFVFMVSSNMSLEEFLTSDLGSETFRIAAAYQLLEWAKLVASNNDKKEKEKKYEELQEEVATLVEKYEVTRDELFGADCDLDAELPEDDVLMERADKLVAHEEGWMY